MKNSKRDNRVQFVNLAAELSQQNEVVIQTIDDLIAGCLKEPGVEQRADWQQIQHTIETDVVNELTFGSTIKKPHCAEARSDTAAATGEGDDGELAR